MLNQRADEIDGERNCLSRLGLEYLEQILVSVGTLGEAAGVRMQSAWVGHQPARAQARREESHTQRDSEEEGAEHAVIIYPACARSALFN
jgi:hypothetical protein